MAMIDPEKALDFMRDNAKHLAEAKANRVYLEQWRKSQRALLFTQAPDDCKTVLAKEAYAYSHELYIEVLEGLRVAVEEEERLRWLMVAANLKVDVWRSQESSNRRIDKAHQ
jgi:hypothetical protein